MDVLNPPLSEDPSSKVYKVHLPLAESADAAAAATDSDWGLRECKFYCYKEFHHCQGLLFDGTKCYLTSTFVNVDPPTVNVPRELTWNTLTCALDSSRLWNRFTDESMCFRFLLRMPLAQD